MSYFDTTIVGTKYRGKTAVQIVAMLRRGTRLRLQREPKNKHDQDAIAVYWRENHLGYIPRSNNSELALVFAGRRASELAAEVTFEAIVAGNEIKFAPKIRVNFRDDDVES